MDSSAELRRSGFWTAVVLYGLALAALVFVLKYIEYRYLLREHAWPSQSELTTTGR